MKSSSVRLSVVIAALATGCSNSRAPATTTSAGNGARTPLEIDFTEQPSYVPHDTLSLTFDDGPLPPYTGQVLDVLKARGVHATFFITTQNNDNDVDDDPENQELVRRIVSEGHGLANHTVHHYSLKTLDASAMEAEITGVERTAGKVLGDRDLHLTLLRAPYGEPYQDHFLDPGDADAGAAYPAVAAVVSKHAVHVGWNVETDDWRCTTGTPQENADCVYGNFTRAVKTVGAPGAQWGIVLMHCVNPQTVAALPRILDYVAANHFKLVSVEDVVRMRFGERSASLVRR